MERILNGGLEENIITLLCWSERSAPIIRIKVDSDLFSTTAYRYIVRAAFDYIDEFRTPPQDHISDLLETMLNKDTPISRLLSTTIVNMKNYAPTINESFVLGEYSFTAFTTFRVPDMLTS